MALVWGVGVASQGTYATAAHLNASATTQPFATDLAPDAAGVATWVGLFAILVAMAGNVLVLRRGAPAGTPREGDMDAADDASIVERFHPPDSWTGVGLVALFTVAALAGAWAFFSELGGAHRASLLGILGAVVLASLAEVVTVYGAWFVPRTTVVEDRPSSTPTQEGSP